MTRYMDFSICFRVFDLCLQEDFLSDRMKFQTKNVEGFIVLSSFSTQCSSFPVEPAEAFSCANIMPAVEQCASFATGRVARPSGGCCNELNRLPGMTRTTADRRPACNCLKQIAPQYPGVKDSLLLALPQKFGVTLSFSITRNTDCNRVT
ncbi:non-specific lipid-transfer protein 1-like [Olea europaea var. sylvestris]|nr:non-specific lipid-transfer protein 1-like [Olea europaea var. sylvestris]